MTEKEIRSLRRADLLEMLVDLSEQMEELKRQHAESQKDLKEQLAAANNQLRKREISLEKSGSIAEAALELNDVFGAAQKAAEMYVENIESRYAEIDRRCREKELESQEKADRILLDTIEKCGKRVADAESKAEEIKLQAQIEADLILTAARREEADVRKRCKALLRGTKIKCEEYQKDAEARVRTLLDSHDYLKDLFGKR